MSTMIMMKAYLAAAFHAGFRKSRAREEFQST
jgi:hypothetical protein